MSEASGNPSLSTSVWHRPLVPEEAKDRLAKRQANAAVALLRLKREQNVWPLLRHRPDPRTRSYLIHRFRPLDADPKQVVSQLDTQEDVSIRRALILTLGEFNDHQLPHQERGLLTPRLLDLYANDADPGIHGAAAWTLRQWGHRSELQNIDREFATGSAHGCRRWFVNRQGQSLIIVEPPGEIVIGSPPFEAGREDGPEGDIETQRHVRIDHTFAIMAHQVSVAEFLRFQKEFNYRKIFSPDNSCPINSVSWYDATAYCNWLNVQEGIPREQWCYIPNEKGEYAQGMKIASDFLGRSGYRLPTESEWEYACRANSITSRYYGQSADLDNFYAWTVQNSLARGTMPVGTFKPNDFGLFDMMGNVMDWCHDVFHDSFIPFEGKQRILISGQSQVDEDQPRVVLGASMLAHSEAVRSAYQYTPSAPNAVNPYWGFRLSKTCLETPEKASSVSNERLRVLRGPGINQYLDRIRSVYRGRFSPNLKTHAFSIRTIKTISS